MSQKLLNGNAIVEFLLRKIGALDESERLVKVKSLSFSRDSGGLLGPTLLVDQYANRQTIRRIYQGRIAQLFRDRNGELK